MIQKVEDAEILEDEELFEFDDEQIDENEDFTVSAAPDIKVIEFE